MPISNTAPDQRVWITLNNGGAGFTALDRDGADTASSQWNVYQSTAGVIRPNDIVFDTVHGLYFFADSVDGNRRILQGNIADLQNPMGPPALTVLYSDSSPGTAGGQIQGLAIDVDHATGQGAIYFVNQGNFNRVTYDHDGTSPTNQVPTLLAQLPSGSFANEIALDIDNNRAFVLSTASDTQPTEVPEGTPGAIYDEDGGVWFIYATTVTNNEIWQISGLDRTNSSTGDTSIARLSWIGGDNGGQDLQGSLGLLQSIDIDPTTGLLYFTTQQINSGAFGEVGGIYRYNLAAGTYETLYAEDGSTDYSFEYIDVDPVSGRYYVTNLSFDDITGANTSSVFVHGLSAGTPTLFANVGNAAGAVPQGVIVINAPTVTGVEGGATTTETAGAGSGQSSDAMPVGTADANDGDTAGQVDQLAGAQVRISSGFGSSPGSVELLTINGTTAGVLDFGDQDIAYSYNGGTGVMTLTGASTFAAYESALALVAYSISGDNPDNYGASPTRTLSYSVFDGALYSDEFNSTVTIAGTNDAPVNTTGGAVAASEDGGAVAVTGLSVSDVNSNALTVTLSVANGTINVTTGVAGGLGAGQVSGNGTGSVVLSGTSSEINTTLAAMNGVTYTPAPDFNGSDTLQMVSDDGDLSDTDSVAITVGAVADIAGDAASATEDSAASVFVLANDSFENVPAITGFTQGANGSVALNDNGTAGDTTDDYLVYTGNADFNGADSFSYTVTSGGATETATVNVTVNAVADIVGDNVTVDEDSVANALDLLANDNFENAGRSITAVTQGVNGGTVAINNNGTPGNTADDYVTYTPAPNYVGSDSFTYTVTSGGTTETATVNVTVSDFNDPPTGVTGDLEAPEDANNGGAVGTVSAQDPDSSSFTYTLLNDAGGRFAMDSAGNVTVADGLLLDYEQASGHTITVRATDDDGAFADFNMTVDVLDVLGEDVLGDGRDNTFWGGAEANSLRGGAGNDTLKGGGGQDTLEGGDGNDILNGGAGADILKGNSGEDVFVFQKGEANGDTIIDFWGQGASIEDSIVLQGYGVGTTLTRVGSGNSTTYRINDNGYIEVITVIATGQVHTTDWGVVP